MIDAINNGSLRVELRSGMKFAVRSNEKGKGRE